MDDVDRLTRIFELQGSLQLKYGHDFNQMDDENLVEYIRVNMLAIASELHEAFDETYWKPWAKHAPGFKDRDRYAAELSDVLHFFLNLCLAARMTPDELMSRYEGKNEVNQNRIASGYDGTEKCDVCKGALDEPSIVKIWPGESGERYCSRECQQDAMLAWVNDEDEQNWDNDLSR